MWTDLSSEEFVKTATLSNFEKRRSHIQFERLDCDRKLNVLFVRSVNIFGL
jgi:hypothetical protein